VEKRLCAVAETGDHFAGYCHCHVACACNDDRADTAAECEPNQEWAPAEAVCCLRDRWTEDYCSDDDGGREPYSLLGPADDGGYVAGVLWGRRGVLVLGVNVNELGDRLREWVEGGDNSLLRRRRR
jgi:hypothetical protein